MLLLAVVSAVLLLSFCLGGAQEQHCQPFAIASPSMGCNNSVAVLFVVIVVVVVVLVVILLVLLLVLCLLLAFAAVVGGLVVSSAK